LDGEIQSLVGVYTIKQMNQVIIAYHVKAQGEIVLDKTELEDYRLVKIHDLHNYPIAKGLMVKDWLELRGIKSKL
jgi:hypothetical protein